MYNDFCECSCSSFGTGFFIPFEPSATMLDYCWCTINFQQQHIFELEPAEILKATLNMKETFENLQDDLGNILFSGLYKQDFRCPYRHSENGSYVILKTVRYSVSLYMQRAVYMHTATLLVNEDNTSRLEGYLIFAGTLSEFERFRIEGVAAVCEIWRNERLASAYNARHALQSNLGTMD